VAAGSLKQLLQRKATLELRIKDCRRTHRVNKKQLVKSHTPRQLAANGQGFLLC